MFPYIIDSGVCDVINNCQEIKSIVFNSRVNITHKTIEELIKLALNKPKTQFKHQFIDIESENMVFNNILFTAINLKVFNDLPKNLLLNTS